MPYHFNYVPESEYMPVKKQLIELINRVQAQVRDSFTFSFTFVGSTDRGLITRDERSNIGFDIDVNLHVNGADNYTAEEVKNILRNAFNRQARSFGFFSDCEDNTRVLTIKNKDIYCFKINYSFDIAIVKDFPDGHQQYIHHNKVQRSYEWKSLKKSESELKKRADFLKELGKWEEVKALYLDKKNNNDNPDRLSRSIFAETINDLYIRYTKRVGKK